MWQRAVAITRQLNVAPWIGLAVAERRITLAEASQCDRAARCQALQAAILDKGLPLPELRACFPYAPYFLAPDLAEAINDPRWDGRDALPVAEALLAIEKQLDAEGRPLPVRRRSMDEYVKAAQRMRALMKQTGCDAAMAAEVEQGKTDAAFVAAYMRQRNWFENPRRRDGEGPDDGAPRRAPLPRGPRRNGPPRDPRSPVRHA